MNKNSSEVVLVQQDHVSKDNSIISASHSVSEKELQQVIVVRLHDNFMSWFDRELETPLHLELGKHASLRTV